MDMKLLVISPHYRTFVKDLVEAESKYIDEIYVIVHHNYLSELAHYLSFFPYFKYVKMFSKKRLSDLTGKPKNVQVHILSTFYFIPDGKNQGLGIKLSNLFKKYIEKNNIKFDLIHAHFTWPSGYVAVKLGKEFNVPVVVTAHGYDVYDLPFRNKKWRRKIRYVLNSANYVITVSKKNMSLLNELGINTPVKLIPNGFKSDLFYPQNREKCRKNLNLPLDKIIIITVGNLTEVKGHKYLIQAMAKIVKQKKDIICIIVGGGKLENRLNAEIKKLGLKNYIKLVGQRPHNEIPLWMNAADVFVLPSLCEGNPTVMFEALGVGLPFVGTTVGGIPEIIISEDYGLLCPPKDPECLAEKILTALEKDWDREKIKRYAKQFTWENIARRILNVYKLVLNDAGK